MLKLDKSEDFDKVIKNGMVLVVMKAIWCKPCVALAPVLQSLSEELAGSVSFYEVDVDENPELSKRLGIKGVPTLVAFEDGKEIGRIVGLVGKDNIKKLLKV